MSAAIELINVHKKFGPTEVIGDVSLAVEQGTRHAIIGPNGAGKSTLFNLITGRFPVTSGTVQLLGHDITGHTPQDVFRRGLARSFQVTNIFPNLSVYENLRCGALWDAGYRYSFWHLVDRARDVNERAEEVLEFIGMTRKRELQAGLLSYADQRALELGITIAGGAKVLCLDEPTSGMSRAETDEAVELIRKVSHDRTLVIVEHDMSVIFNLADRITVLVYGEVIASDTPEAIRTNKDVQEAYLGTDHV